MITGKRKQKDTQESILSATHGGYVVLHPLNFTNNRYARLWSLRRRVSSFFLILRNWLSDKQRNVFVSLSHRMDLNADSYFFMHQSKKRSFQDSWDFYEQQKKIKTRAFLAASRVIFTINYSVFSAKSRLTCGGIYNKGKTAVYAQPGSDYLHLASPDSLTAGLENQVHHPFPWRDSNVIQTCNVTCHPQSVEFFFI